MPAFILSGPPPNLDISGGISTVFTSNELASLENCLNVSSGVGQPPFLPSFPPGRCECPLEARMPSARRPSISHCELFRRTGVPSEVTRAGVAHRIHLPDPN